MYTQETRDSDTYFSDASAIKLSSPVQVRSERWLCHNNRGSKSTAMRQQLQMHELYRSLGLGGAEMRRSHDLYVDGVLKHLHLIQWCVLQQSLCLRSVHQSKHSRASSS